jgi:hypothetical protein
MTPFYPLSFLLVITVRTDFTRKEGGALALTREEKRRIRREIISVLDAECNGCKYIKVRKTRDPYCADLCPVGERLQSLSAMLIQDNELANEKKAKPKSEFKRRPWTEEEVLYLLNHSKYFSMEHLAEKLHRSVDAVYLKFCSLKKHEKQSAI